MLECVANVSEGQDSHRLRDLSTAAGAGLLDVHSDADHHRSVFTMIGTEAVRRLTDVAIDLLDVNRHRGVHPRLGVVDVVPFVPLGTSTMGEALTARDEFGAWVVDKHRVPVFFYGPDPRSDRQLPDIRRNAWRSLQPDIGPSSPHPTAGAICVGARQPLVAYNVWLDSLLTDEEARCVRDDVRSDAIRVLTLTIDGRTQVSMNLIDPHRVGPYVAYASVDTSITRLGKTIRRAELVGLIEDDVLRKIPESEWSRLDISRDRTIESRLARR